MPVLLSSALHAQLLAHAASAHPLECCGLLLGSDQEIETARPCANVADDPATGFEIDPAALIAAERAMRQGGKRLIGHYHSHPNGRSAPSPRGFSRKPVTLSPSSVSAPKRPGGVTAAMVASLPCWRWKALAPHKRSTAKAKS